jgi:hypothetical protein
MEEARADNIVKIFCLNMKEDFITKDYLYYIPSLENKKILDTSTSAFGNDEDFDIVFAKQGDDISHLYKLLRTGGTICVKGHTRKDTYAALKRSGAKQIEVYLAYPSQNLPRLIIPRDDIEAIRFSLRVISAGAKWRPLIYALSFIPGVVFVMSMLSRYIIIAKK